MDERGGEGLKGPRMVLLVEDAKARNGRSSDRRIAAFDAEFVLWAKENEEASRLTTIPGFGPIIASARVAAVGQAESFNHGRDLAAWLGLVPRQFTTGGKPKLLGISKRGNKYLRKQLIHGARAALPYVAERDTPLGRWAKGLMLQVITSECRGRRLWPPSWRGSPGRCCSAGNRLTPKRVSVVRAGGSPPVGAKAPVRASGVLREGDVEMALTVKRRSGSLVLKAAHDAEEFDEDRGARIFHLGREKTSEAGYVEAD